MAHLAIRHQISRPEFSTLWACRERSTEGLGQKELAARLAASPAQVSGLVERLRRRGLLEGHRPDGDRRRQLWRLTSTGRARLREILADLADWAGPLDVRFGVEGLQTLSRLLERLADEIGDRCVSHDKNRKGAA